MGMKGEGVGDRHRRRFARWQQRVSPQTRLLCELVESRVVPVLTAPGFRWVDLNLGRSDWPVNPNEIELERVSGDVIDSIDISFGKYDRARFQIGFSRHERAPPNEFIRSGNLVKNASQYYCFWGKPWWLPKKFWPARSAKRVVEGVVPLLEQVVRFLETGERGPNISRQVSQQPR